MSLPSSQGAVVIDANVLIAVCAKEQNLHVQAEAALNDYATRGWLFYAPGVVVAETLYILCRKLQAGTLTTSEHDKAIKSFQVHMQGILPSPRGDASLITRAEEVRSGYGCSRSADGIYIALAEDLSKTGPTKLLTFDQDLENQVKQNAPTVSVHLIV